MSLCISDDGAVLVKAPLFMSDAAISKFLAEKQGWLDKKRKEAAAARQEVERLGRFSAEELVSIRKRAKEIIPERVAHYSKLSGISYGRISIRLQKSRWGSCSARGNLNFNCLLVLMPPEILDSVVVHELCHRRHMNHSKAFYAEVLSIFPDYRRCSVWLKQHGAVYLARASQS
ncbi:MAG: M48 family metallopeptidase [Spirochaetaceae bacterium]|nr:M48 family metallopeptidase [Spirochaetaceae bacterium]